MNFNQAKIYFEQGVQTGSAKSHFVCSDIYLNFLQSCFNLGTLFYE
jgi:hypothetical protein